MDGLPAPAVVNRFKLHIRCYNCERDNFLPVATPSDVTTEDELIDSGALERVRFQCPRCEGAIGEIVGVMPNRCFAGAASLPK